VDSFEATEEEPWGDAWGDSVEDWVSLLVCALDELGEFSSEVVVQERTRRERPKTGTERYRLRSRDIR
jgi:hypothetical protein